MSEIPYLKEGEEPSSDYAEKLSKAINSDGCTGVAEIHHNCCVYHDLGYRYGFDIYHRPVSRAEVDMNFRRCMQQDSKLGRFDPVSWVRWAGVRIFGRFFYHR